MMETFGDIPEPDIAPPNDEELDNTEGAMTEEIQKTE
jgi:hypothetical protein